MKTMKSLYRAIITTTTAVALALVASGSAMAAPQDSSINTTTQMGTATLSKQELQTDLIDKIDPYVIVEDGRYVIRDENQVSLVLTQFAQSHSDLNLDPVQTLDLILDQVRSINAYVDKNLLKNSTDKAFVPTQRNRDTGSDSVYYWWGVTHTFYSDSAAHSYTYNVRMAAHLNSGAALIGGAVFGGVGAIPNGITAVWGYMTADSVVTMRIRAVMG